MTWGISAYAVVATLIFGIGAAGLIIRRNYLVQMMCIELMLNAVNVLLVAFNRLHPENHAGQMFAFFVIAVAAAEAAVGLAIVIAYYRLKKSVDTDQAHQLEH